jgi:hypothetical protein
MPKFKRVLITGVTASVLLAGGTGIAAASPNGRALPVEPAGRPAGGRRGVARVGPVRGGGAGSPGPLIPQPHPSNRRRRT